MTDLSPAEFPQFIREVYGYEPFPWQTNLAATVCDTGWPDQIQMPTGAGKTIALDIAVFHLALEAPRQDRSAPTRIFYTIDRRVVVDQASQRTHELLNALTTALESKSDSWGVTRKVAQRLQQLGGDVPLVCDRLRGGLFNDDVWFADPAQPAVYATTVDQIGSRLLFRGYGVTDSMKPVHAGLAGMDALYILDEVHLSQPFKHTLDRAKQLHTEEFIELPFETVSMSATPVESGWRSPETRDEDRAHKELGPRLRSTKATKLVETTADSHVEALVSSAHQLVDLDSPDPRRIIGVTVNTVQTAREVYDTLTNHSGDCEGDKQVSLLVGRARGWEKNRTKGQVEAIASRRVREDTPDHPHFVVATQTIEVGADFDFDALVTELAPLDSLRQRLGRVDRFGELGDAQIRVVAQENYVEEDFVETVECLECGDRFSSLGRHLSSHDINKAEYKDKYWDGAYEGAPEHPVYGRSLKPTYDWLREHEADTEAVDLGATGVDLPAGQSSRRAAMCAPKKSAPTLVTPYLDLLCQTAPRPSGQVDPDLSLFLHGPDSFSENVQLVWRGDLFLPGQSTLSEPSVSTQDMIDPAYESEYIDAVSNRPPLPAEIIDLPIWAVQRWLSTPDTEQSTVAIPDAEGGGTSTTVDMHDPMHILLWRGADNSEVGTVDDIQPGDTLILPSAYGGHGMYAFDAANQTPVDDISFHTTVDTDGVAPSVALTPALVRHLTTDRSLLSTVEESILDPGLPEADENIPAVLTQLAQSLSDTDNTRLGNPKYTTALRELADSYDAAVHPLYKGQPEGDRYPVVTESALESAGSGKASQYLEPHLHRVETKASDYTARISLPESIATAVQEASKYHDLGKLEQRFQLWLGGGEYSAEQPLAKSGVRPSSRASQRARKLSGYPAGRRHEAISADLFGQLLTGDESHTTLTRHLIGSHHGYGRPLFPTPPENQSADTTSGTVFGDEFDMETEYDHYKLSKGWPEQYWSLIEEYGPWTLAYLESFVRIADQRVSEAKS